MERRERMMRDIWVRTFFAAIESHIALPKDAADIADEAARRFEVFDEGLCGGES